MKRYTLRGASGFLGSKFKELLELSEHKISNLNRDWKTIPKTADFVVNFSAYGNNYEQKNLEETYKVNLMDSIRILKESRCPVVLISTSSVLLPVQTPYSASKKAMEEMALIYARDHNKKVVIVRPSTVTGVGEQPTRLISKLIRSCLYGEEMRFIGTPTHDFIDVVDFCEELIYITENIDDYCGKVLNLSSGINFYSNQEVLKIVEQETKDKAIIKRVPMMRTYDSDKWVVEDSFPQIQKKSLRRIIKEMVDYELQRTNN
jgi:nucleoside-diphosphate-sugar epimerase